MGDRSDNDNADADITPSLEASSIGVETYFRDVSPASCAIVPQSPDHAVDSRGEKFAVPLM